jgi:hypothetical protein
MLIITKDRKTTNSVLPSGKAPRIGNAFSIPAGKKMSCPGATSVCESICYAGKLEKMYPNFRKSVLHNWDLVKDSSGPEIEILLVDMLDRFVSDCDKWDAPKEFRIHADGDFFNNNYIMAWIHIMQKFSGIRFWVYTRNAVAAIRIHKAVIDNCSLYFSGDKKNIAAAQMLNKIHGIRIAMLGETFDEAKELFPKAVRCPENNKAIPLISNKGSACAVCRLCIDGKNNVLFSKTKR